MANRYKPGDTAFIVESSRFIREVRILTIKGGIVSLRFSDAEGGIRIRESRLFPTKEEAEASTKKRSRSNPF